MMNRKTMRNSRSGQRIRNQQAIIKLKLCSLSLLSTVVFVAFGRSLATAGQAVPDDRAEQREVFEEGKRQLSEGHLPQAIAAFDRLKQMDPLKPQAYFFQGVAYAESGHLNAAAAELNEALRLGPEQPEHALALGNVLARLGQKQQAIRVLSVFEPEAALNRLSTQNLSELMKVYFSLERTSEALRIVNELAVREPGFPRIDFYRAKIYKLKGELDLAQQAIEKSLQKYPGNPADLFELGKIHEQRGQMAAAKKAFSEALTYQPNNPETLYAMGSVCLFLNEIDEAILYLKRSETGGVSLPKIYYALGQAYLKRGNKEKRAEYFQLLKSQESKVAQRQRELREQEELTLVTLGSERRKQGSVFEARELFQQVLELNPNHWEAHRHLAEIGLSLEDWQQAYVHLSRMQEIDPSAFQGNRLMAEYWYRRKDYAQAARFGEQAASIQPSNAELRNLLGSIYLSLGQLEKALEEYGYAVKYAPERPDFRKDFEAAQELVKTPPK